MTAPRDLSADIIEITDRYHRSFIARTSEREYLADELTRLGYRATPGWVACSERMPTPGARVWASDPDIGLPVKWYPLDGFWGDVLGGIHDPERISHWMPLPIPPITTDTTKETP